MQNKVQIIAEAGVNHNGCLKTAAKLVEVAAESGADFVKFQIFKAASLASQAASKAEYQKSFADADDSQLSMLSSLELGFDFYPILMRVCEEKGVKFLASAFDYQSMDFLLNTLQAKTVKIGSGEITNAPLLLQAARSGSDIFLSTGMSSIDEVQEALGVIAFGILNNRPPVSRGDFSQALSNIDWQNTLKDRVSLLHCTSEYPAPLDETNLRSVQTMSSYFGLQVGYSDHTEDDLATLAAVAMGARVIEKHITLDRSMPGPDHIASLDPASFAKFVSGIRQLEAALGSGVKSPAPAEQKNISIVRKSLVAKHDLEAGHWITPEDISLKRPGDGISPMDYWSVVGRQLATSVRCDDVIHYGDLK